jgi:hypothetical protein
LLRRSAPRNDTKLNSVEAALSAYGQSLLA